MGEVKSYLQSGKLGDFIHGLVVCKYNYDLFNQKADLYITNNDGAFEMGLEFTYNDLKSVILEQEWINKFEIYDNQDIDFKLNSFRHSRFLHSTNWIEIYFNEFLNEVVPPKEYSWIKIPKDPSLSNTLLINRSISREITPKIIDFYNQILESNKDLEIGFVCYCESQYNAFPLKDKCKLIKVNTLYDFFQKINSCKLYVGNQSGPSAFATSMNVPRMIELINGEAAIHYIKDSYYYSNFKYFKEDFLHL